VEAPAQRGRARRESALISSIARRGRSPDTSAGSRKELTVTSPSCLAASIQCRPLEGRRGRRGRVGERRRRYARLARGRIEPGAFSTAIPLAPSRASAGCGDDSPKGGEGAIDDWVS
jgi:hypothetical protein